MDAEENLGFAANYLCGTVVVSARIAPRAEQPADCDVPQKFEKVR